MVLRTPPGGGRKCRVVLRGGGLLLAVGGRSGGRMKGHGDLLVTAFLAMIEVVANELLL